jgi:hypothetical protein
MQTSSAIAAALVSGASDIGYVIFDVLTTVREKHITLIAIAGTTECLSPQTERIAGIVVRVSSPVHMAKNLNGHRSISSRQNWGCGRLFGTVRTSTTFSISAFRMNSASS